MNAPSAEDIIRAELDLLVALGPIVIAGVSTLVVIVAIGVWELVRHSMPGRLGPVGSR